MKLKGHSRSPSVYDVKSLYFILSFGVVLFEISAVCLYTAWVNDASKEPTHVLDLTPSATYDTEV